MRQKVNITYLNAFLSLSLQIVTIICGFIIPKLILSNFGSEVNGLVTSFNQFFGYMSLVEGGFCSVVMAKLYAPLVKKDNESISAIVATSKSFYNKFSLLFIAYTIGLCVIYPLVVKSSFSYSYVCFLGLILGLGLLIQYNFALALRTLLNADKKVWLVAGTQIFISIANLLLFYVVIRVYPNIHLLKLITGLLYIVQPIVYNAYISRKYKLDSRAKTDKALIKDRWNGFAISLAAFIHNNTDVIVLTVFCSLKTVSVYSVYALVTVGLRQLIKSLSAGVIPTIGNTYAKGDRGLTNELFERYEFVILFLSFFVFSVGFVLITPFVLLYTRNVTDISYNEPLFGYLLVISELVFCIREPYINITFAADKFKEMTASSFIESGLNIVVSIVLVHFFGLIGVAIGTLVAMLYKTIYQIVYLKNNVLYRKPSTAFKNIFLFASVSVLGIVICLLLSGFFELTILSWIVQGLIYSGVFCLLFFALIFVFFRHQLRAFIEKFKRRLHGTH